MTEQAQQYVDSLNLEYKTEFVPQSKSRNASEKNPSLNWLVTIGRGPVQIRTDYMQGIGHLPHYNHAFARLAVYDEAVREAAETGKSRIVKAKNGYDACHKWENSRRKPEPIPAPALIDVLHCLVMDADVLNYACFDDWVENTGFDTDSREAERIYKACLQTALPLRQLINLDEAAEAFQDY